MADKAEELAAMAMQNKGVTSASEWKKASRGTPLRVPSGNTCLVKVLGMEAFLQQGMIPNSLMRYITGALAKGKPPSQQPEFLSLETLNPAELEEIIGLFNNVVVAVVIEPKVYPVPPEGEAKDDQLLYVDEVAFDDKVFIFQYAVGGTRDLEKFRSELTADVEAVQDGTGVALPTQ